MSECKGITIPASQCKAYIAIRWKWQRERQCKALTHHVSGLCRIHILYPPTRIVGEEDKGTDGRTSTSV